MAFARLCNIFRAFSYTHGLGFLEGFFRYFSQFSPILFDRSSIAKINLLSGDNVVSVGRRH